MVGVTIALLKSLGTCIARKQCVRSTLRERKTFQTLERIDYQCHKCKCTCQVRNIPLEQQNVLFVLKCEKRILKRQKNQDIFLLDMCFVQHAQRKVFLPVNQLQF